MTTRRRWLLCGAIVACLVGGILTWIGWRASARRATIDVILTFDASIGVRYREYEYEPPPMSEIRGDDGTIFGTLFFGGGQRVVGYLVIDEPPRFLAWATPLFGKGIGAHVTEIEIFDERFTDNDVDLLLAFPDLRELDLPGTGITDEGLTKLAASLDQLVKLDVSATKVTGRSTRLLSNCKQLRELDLRETADSETVAEELQKQLTDCLIFR
jgi:hypothetical protein